MVLRTPAATLLATVPLPRPEAEFLLEHLLQCKRHELYLAEKPVPSAIRRRFLTLAHRAAQGEPVQYLVQSAPFLDFELYVDPRVFIPRPETEELVLRAVSRLHPVLSSPQRLIVIDFGTGSGCIAIALARMFPRLKILAVDSSPAALEVCRLNCYRLRVASRIRTILASDFSHPQLARLRGKVTLLISNPPYVPTSRLRRLEAQVKNYEPHAALDGGPKGTNIVTMLLNQGRETLTPGGLLALEIDSAAGRYLTRLAPEATLERDLSGRIRYLFSSREVK